MRRRIRTPQALRGSRPATRRGGGTAGAVHRLMRAFRELVATRSGLDESEARHAIDIVEEAIAPGSLLHVQELHYRLARRLGIEPGRAVEVAQIVCHAIAARLDLEHRAQLLSRLPGELRPLFEPPPSLTVTTAAEPHLAGTGHTLADGRPGSAHPLSESRPPHRPR